jgi:dihydrofolate reductase
MIQYWPTPMAAKNDPVVAEQMNNLQKVVFSRTLKEATWKNTTLVNGDLAAEVRKLKEGSGHDMVILGSGSIVAQLAQEGLIDEFQIVVQPVVLGSGETLFAGVKDAVDLSLGKTRTFPSGKSSFATHRRTEVTYDRPAHARKRVGEQSKRERGGDEANAGSLHLTREGSNNRNEKCSAAGTPAPRVAKPNTQLVRQCVRACRRHPLSAWSRRW